MSDDLKTIALERMYCIRIGSHATAMVEAEARELYELLHAEFGPRDTLFERIKEQVRVPGIADPLRPPYEVGPYNPFDGPTCRIPIHPTAEGLDRLAADLGVTPVTAPVSETPLLRHEGMDFPEPGPTLNEDIEAMIANQPAAAVLDLETGIITDITDDREQEDWCSNCNNERCAGLGCKDITDDADEQEQEFLSRLPKIAVAPDVADAPSTVNGIPVGELTMSVAEEPKSAEGAYKGIESVSKDVVSSSGTVQTWQDRLLELWAKYADKPIPERFRIIYTSTRSSKFAELRAMDTAMLRQALRDMGIDVPDPMTPQERAAIARAKRLANAAQRLEPPKVEEPKPEATKLTPAGLVDRVPVPPLELGWQDQLALTFEVLDASETPKTFSSYYTAKCGSEEIVAYVGEVAELRDDYWLLLPFERREFKEALSAKWRKVAA